MFNLNDVSLLKKILISMVGAMIVSTVVISVIFVKDYKENAYDEIYFKARAIGQMAENTRINAGKSLVEYKAIKSEELPCGSPEEAGRPSAGKRRMV